MEQEGKRETRLSVLVAVENYPGSASGDKVTHQFVHVRNLYYRSLGIDVTVLNFSEHDSYVFEEIPVIGPTKYKRFGNHYDLLVCHQPNLKHHLPFCAKHLKEFRGVIFFFHGHEVLKISASYPKPYPYIRQSVIKVASRDIYDEIKFKVLRRYFKKIKDHAFFVFVSQWMYDEFMKWLKVDATFLGTKAQIIPNCIGEAFENNRYTPIGKAKYDLITVRGNIDTSKYALDLVVRSAESNPTLKYLVVGKGEFFKHYRKPDNLVWINKTVNHKEIISLLNMSRCALMPTRTDAQGLMMCEMASFGIPLITSDIPVCHEVLDQFENVRFISNSSFECDIKSLVDSIPASNTFRDAFSKKNTIGKEVQLMKNILQKAVS